jgi:hypothetical protein
VNHELSSSFSRVAVICIDLCEETREHLEEKIEELVASGMSKKEAEHAERPAFGNVTLMEEDSRNAWRRPSIEELFSDLRYALRQLRNPGFTSVIVLTFALCVGVNTVNFSLADAIFLRPLRNVRHSERMVRVVGVHGDGYFFNRARELLGFSEPEPSPREFRGVYRNVPRPWRFRPGAAQCCETSCFFRMLSATPLFGREFSPDQFQAGNPAVILSYNFWQQRFGGDPKIVGFLSWALR